MYFELEVVLLLVADMQFRSTLDPNMARGGKCLQSLVGRILTSFTSGLPDLEDMSEGM